MPAAEGLFHKAIIQSGTLLNTMTKEKSQTLASEVLNNLDITAENIANLDTVSYTSLVQAGNDAIKEISGPRKPGTPTMFGFAPSVDGDVLLQQPFSPGFADISKNIPLMIGTTLNELMPVAYAEKELTIEQAKDRLIEKYGEKTEHYIELFAKAYPEYTPQDLLSLDTVFRPYTIRTADARANKANAPVYTYFLAWKSPVDSASRGSFHGLDIPLAFNNVDLRPDWTGNSEKAWELADKMSSAWLNFAKKGNPNVEGVLPAWEPYTPENGATMYFDNKCRIVNNHDRELMDFILSN
jgi:para-nitrobenzyl esterase